MTGNQTGGCDRRRPEEEPTRRTPMAGGAPAPAPPQTGNAESEVIRRLEERQLQRLLEVQIRLRLEPQEESTLEEPLLQLLLYLLL